MARQQQVIQHFRDCARQAEQLIASYQEVGERTRAALERAQAGLQTACLDLSRAYLPTLDANALARVVKLTGFLGFQRRDPIAAMQHERHVLESTAARIEADARYVEREMHAGPDGTLRTEIAKAEELGQPFEAECARFEELEGFTELIACKYDTPEFGLKFWHKDYWRIWAAGDRICEELGLGDFGDDVLPRYEKAAKERNFWRDERAKHQRALDDIHELVRKHDEALAMLPNLPEVFLAGSQEQLAAHLKEADIGLLEQWRAREAPSDAGIEMALRRVAGLRAKVEMLERVEEVTVARALSDLGARRAKYLRNVSKYSRDKYGYVAISDGVFDRRFEAKAGKLRERADKLGLIVSRMDHYDDYERFALDNDEELWWYEFTRTKPPRQLPELRRYYDAHPGATPLHDDRDDDDAAAVAMAVNEAAARERDTADVDFIS